jgi:NitT/TauT family transport system ATP-binding protein
MEPLCWPNGLRFQDGGEWLTASSPQNLISLDGVSKTYVTSDGEELEAVRSISLNVPEGQFVSLVGRSGCGKTTLLKIISGLLKPSKGKVTVFGTEVNRPVGSVGFVFQNPLLMPWRSVLENIMIPVELMSADRESFEARAAALVNVTNLSGFERLRPKELSGGMQQRVAIARALLLEPRILMMDEPFGSLDELTREEMSIELLRIAENVNKTTIFVTHSVTESVLLSDRVIVLSPRPSSVAEDIEVALPRPRSFAQRSSKEFEACCAEIRRSLGLTTADKGKA